MKESIKKQRSLAELFNCRGILILLLGCEATGVATARRSKDFSRYPKG